MKREKWLQKGCSKKMQALLLTAALVMTGAVPSSVYAEETSLDLQEREEQQETETTVTEETVQGDDISAEPQEEKAEQETLETKSKETEETKEATDVKEDIVLTKALFTTANGMDAVQNTVILAPVGLLADSPKDSVLTVVYGPSSAQNVVRYIIYLDGEVLKEDAQVAFYTFEEIAPGEHTVQVTAVLEDGSESPKENCQVTVTVKGEQKPSEDDPKDPVEDAKDALNLELADTSLWCGGNDGWAQAFAEVTEEGSSAVITASNYGNWDANEWAIQYKVAGVQVTQGTKYKFSCEMLSETDKLVTWKIHDEGEGVLYKQFQLKAGEKYSFEADTLALPADETQLILALGRQGEDAADQSGKVTISNIKLTTLSEEQKPQEDEKETKEEIVVSESQKRAVCGRDVVLTFSANHDFSQAVDQVLVNGTEVTFDRTDTSVTIPGTYFGEAGVYKIVITADGYSVSNIYQEVFAEDIWELVFADEFDGNSLNTDIWSYQIGTGAEYGLNGWGNEEEQYYTSDNASVANGTLTIEAKKEAKGGKTYTSGRIRSLADSNTGFSTTYGRVEAKIKMPKGDGIWPAFWMLPSTDTYGTWASSGEIDIMEARGRLIHQVLGTLHYGENWPNNKSSGVTYELPENSSITEYHVYALEWDVDTMIWYVDGVETYRTSSWYAKGSGQSKEYDYPAPYDEPFHIVLNMAVGGTFDGMRRPDDSIFEEPVTMDVDYVRVYRNATQGYYDREAQKPQQETDEESFVKFQKEYADSEGNYITDTAYTVTQQAAGVLSSDMKGDWTRHWYYLLGDYGAEAVFATAQEDGSVYATADISNGGNQNYAVQLVQHLPLVKGYTYEVSFDAYASKSRSMIIKLAGDDDNGWGAYSNLFAATLTTQPKHYQYTFTMTGDTDETARLEFNMGLDTGKISIANVAVKVAEQEEGKEDEEDGKHDTPLIPVGNAAPEFSEWTHYVGSEWAYVSSLITACKEHDIAVTVAAAGGWSDTAWGVQLYQAGIPVVQNCPYEIRFTAKAEQNKKVAFKLEDAAGTELIYQEYALTAGKEEEIVLSIEKMPAEMVKAYFAMGVFADETNINTTIQISDFTIYNLAEDEIEEPIKPVNPVRPQQNQSAGSQTQESSSASTLVTAVPTVVTPVARISDKLADVIFDSSVALAAAPGIGAGAPALGTYDLILGRTDGILTAADLLKLRHNSMILNALFSDRLAVTLDSTLFAATQAMAAMDLDMLCREEIDYGQGEAFYARTWTPKTQTTLAIPVTMHLGLGTEHAGRNAYLFAKNLETGEMVCRQVSQVSSIGNITYTTAEYSEIVVLIQR